MKEQGWFKDGSEQRVLTWITNNELEKFKLNFSRSVNHDVPP